MNGTLRSAISLAVAWIPLAAGLPSQSRGQPALLPSTASGWTRADSVGVYAGRDLYLLVDGGADLFFEYGFVRALSTEYSHPPDARAAAELYEMKSPSAAYGLFTSFTAGTGTAVSIGQEAVLGEGYCIFWKGPHVGMVTTSSADSASGHMLARLAGGLEKGLHRTGPLPDLCALLREAGVESQTMVFVRGKLAVGNHFPYAWARPLPPADGVVGVVHGARFLLLEYADSAAADAALRAAAAEWEKVLLPVARDSEGRWTIQQPTSDVARLERLGRRVLAVPGQGGRSDAVSSLFRGIPEMTR